MTHRVTTTYSASFSAFLKCTDEKPVLCGAIVRRLEVFGASSLLDIGAGNGDLARLLAAKIPDYVAVEQNERFVENMRTAGIRVIADRFPCSIDGSFDAVLFSHSLPYHGRGSEEWRQSLDAARALVRPGGHLLIVTYEDVESEWGTFVERIGLPKRSQTSKLDVLEAYLRAYGIVARARITTHVRTSSIEEMIAALGFVWSDGKEEKLARFFENPQVTSVLQEEHFADGAYSFPFHHQMFDLTCPDRTW